MSLCVMSVRHYWELTMWHYWEVTMWQYSFPGGDVAVLVPGEQHLIT